MRVKFTEKFDFTPDEAPTSTVSYKAGYGYLVRRQCGERAVAQGKAIEVETPARRAAAARESQQEARRGRQAQGQGNRSETRG